MIASLSHQIPSKLIEVLKEMGLNQALIGSTMESLKNSCNHHFGIDYVKRNRNVAVESFSQKYCLSVLQPCFEESRAERTLDIPLQEQST